MLLHRETVGETVAVANHSDMSAAENHFDMSKQVVLMVLECIELFLQVLHSGITYFCHVVLT